MTPRPLALLRLLALAALFALAPAARAALEFAGYTTSRDGVRFVVTDLDAKKTSDWLRVGDAFQEHTVTAFDARTETLTLERAGVTLRLPLKGARTAAGPATPAKKPEIHIATSATGEISIDGRVRTDDELRALCRQLAEADQPFELVLHEPPNPNQASFAAAKKIPEFLRQASARRWSLRIVDATPPTAK